MDGSVIADEVSQKATNVGYDANAGKFVDMFKAAVTNMDGGTNKLTLKVNVKTGKLTGNFTRRFHIYRQGIIFLVDICLAS